MRTQVWAVCMCAACCINAGDTAAQQKTGQEGAQSANGWQEQYVENPPTESRGNWYIKRQYVNEAENVYRAVRDLQKEIETAQSRFIEKRDTILSSLKKLHTEYQIDVNTVREKMSDIITRLEASDDEDASHQEHEWLSQARSYKASLNQVQDQLSVLDQLRDRVDRAVSLFDDQLEVIDTYEQKAWETYQAIVQTVSDRVAHEQYRQLQGIQNNAQQIIDYVKNNLMSYMETISSQVTNYVQRVTDAINKIEQGGLRLRNRLEQDDQDSGQDQQHDQHDDEQQQEQTYEQQESQQEQPREQIGWLSQVWSWVVQSMSRVGSWITALWQTLISYLGFGAQE